MNKPFITIPLPSAKDDHQTENAKFYSDLSKLKGFKHHVIKHNKIFGK